MRAIYKGYGIDIRLPYMQIGRKRYVCIMIVPCSGSLVEQYWSSPYMYIGVYS